jgi:hypothetical protein
MLWIADGLTMLAMAIPGCAKATDVEVQALRPEVPVFRQVTTHIVTVPPAFLIPG